MSASLVTTSRSTGQLRGALVRIAQVAAQIVACYERFGPDRPWGFADPTGWKCSRRYCEALAAAAPAAPGCSEAPGRPPGTYRARRTGEKGATMPTRSPPATAPRCAQAGGACPIEAGLLGRLADHECAHGRLPGDRTPKCGCWAQEAAPVIALRDSAPIGNAAAGAPRRVGSGDGTRHAPLPRRRLPRRGPRASS